MNHDLTLAEPVLTAAKAIRLIVFDVDGVLTDGRLHYSSTGEEIKSFHVQDGSALKMLQANGITVALITGRESAMVTRRANELSIAHVYQGSERSTGTPEGKETHYQQLLNNLRIADSAVACVGDDLADLPLLKRCGLSISVPNGHPAVRAEAQHVTRTAGGEGVAREICEILLRAQGKWPY